MTNEEKARELNIEFKFSVAYQYKTLVDVLIEMAAWKEQQMIDKACDLYRKELQQMQKLLAMIRRNAADVLDIEGSVAAFRKAMEE